MCFRFQQNWPDEDLERDIATLLGSLLGIEEIPSEFINASNIALTDPALVVTNEIPRVARMQRFSMIPYGTKNPKTLRVNMYGNATAEKVATSPVWKSHFSRRRCLVPVSGFYDWVHLDAKTKVPYMAYVPGEPMFTLAGIWDRWIDPATQAEVRSFAIITTPPNELWATVHNRMPAILPKETHEKWLDPSQEPDLSALHALLNIFPPKKMAYREFSNYVNSSRNKNEVELLAVGKPVTY